MSLLENQIFVENARFEKFLYVILFGLFSYLFYFILDRFYVGSYIINTISAIIISLCLIKYSHEIIDNIKKFSRRIGVIKKW